MNLLLLLLSLVFIMFFIGSQIIKYHRFKYINELSRIYDEMEMYFIINNITLSKKYIELLKIYKNLIVNTEYLDIQLLLLAKEASEKAGELDKTLHWHKKVVESLPEKGFDVILNKFSDCSVNIIKLSFYKGDFILFFLRIFLVKIIPGLFKHGASSINMQIRKTLDFVFKNEGVITYSGANLHVG